MGVVNVARESWAWVRQKLDGHERRIRALETSHRIGDTAIDGGRLSITGGAVHLRFPGSGPDDPAAVAVGRFSHNDREVYGLLIQDPGGDDVWAAGASPDGKLSFFELYDRAGHRLFAGDEAGVGFRAPLIPVAYGPPLVRSSANTSTGSTDQSIADMAFPIQQPRLQVQVHQITAAGCVGRVSVVNMFTGELYGSVSTGPGNGIVSLIVTPPGDWLEVQYLSVRVRLTTASGSDPYIYGAVIGAYGLGS